MGRNTYNAVHAFPHRFGDTIDRASHSALSHPATVGSNCAAGYLAVYAGATVSRIYHIVEPTVERETHVDERVVKEARRSTLVCIMAAV
jgi:hypothetical protein